MMKGNIPPATIERLTYYRRHLERYLNRSASGANFISSGELGSQTHLSAATVRRDLFYVKPGGKPRLGYDVKKLCLTLDAVLGLDKRWKVVLVGAGNLGKALSFYQGFRKLGFEIVAIFDNDREKVGRNWNGIKVNHIKNIAGVIKSGKIRIAVLAVPFGAAQGMADMLTKAGIKAILNFAPVSVAAPSGVFVRNVDLSTELENLSHFLVSEA